MALILRSHSVNLMAYSKLLYKCHIIDLRVADIKFFSKTAKSFIYIDLLEKPSELKLFREIEQGGLGLICIQTRATAALITTFLQTAINPKFIRNEYHHVLYRHYVLDKKNPSTKTPTLLFRRLLPKHPQTKESCGEYRAHISQSCVRLPYVVHTESRATEPPRS